MENNKEMLTVTETAVRSGLSEHSIRELIKEGNAPVFKVGRCYKIPYSDFMDYIRECSKMKA